MSLDSRLLDLEISNEDERELGPLKYLAETTGKDMGQVVNWFLLLIIFVFDPLAICLVVAANFAFTQIKKPEEPEVDYFEDRNRYLTKVVQAIPENEVSVVLDEELDQEEMIKKNEEILATPKDIKNQFIEPDKEDKPEDIYNESKIVRDSTDGINKDIIIPSAPGRNPTATKLTKNL